MVSLTKHINFEKKKSHLLDQYSAFINVKNEALEEDYNGIFQRYKNPVLEEQHIPVDWQFDLNFEDNPFLLERLEVNTVFNSGAILFNDKICLIPRIEGNDVKSFFAVAESSSGLDGFQFWDLPISMPNYMEPDMNVYDIRLVEHEDGWIYGIFCTERKDHSRPENSSAAIAQCGLARTKDLENWQRLPDIKTPSPQQRNVVLHPEFVNGSYAFYTRPMDGFLSLGSQTGIGWGTVSDILNPNIENERIIDAVKYHTVTEVKNGLGPAPFKTKSGWLHLAHGVRNTASGLRYVLYLFLCDLQEPWRITHYPGRHFMAPRGPERLGDVSNVLFSNGWVMKENGDVFIYYASSDTRTHVATSHIDILLDYVMNTPEDAGNSAACVQQRIELIKKNRKHL